MDQSYHKTILAKEVLEFLRVKQQAWYLDLTLGDGGHSLGILMIGGSVVGIDVDPEALKRAEGRFQAAGIDSSHYKLIQGNFREIDSLIDPEIKFSGAVADLGVSTLQLKVPERGFSLLEDGPLDMRMDPKLEVKAMDLINALNKGELYELFKNYGEELRYAKAVAQAVVDARPLNSTIQLARLVESITGKKSGYTHPATQIFQALRIAVNDEIYVLKEGLPKVLSLLEPGGRLAVLTFHSLEDGTVKNIFKELESSGQGKVLTDKPINPTPEEVYQNYRARSAKLRVMERV